MNDWTIRPYVEDDEEGVVALWKETFPESPAWNVPTDDIRRKLDVQRECFLVAERDGHVIGTAMAGYDGHRGWVYYVAVTPSDRGRGIGSALMRRAERSLREMGCPKLNLMVRATNTGVVRFYESLGYAVEDRVCMARRLED
jgi:ribosomal protein S18 acetylase RimI-like enzyme